VPDLAFLPKRLQSPELILGGKLGVDAMQLIKIDPVQTQAAQASFAGGSQVLGVPVFYPSAGTQPVKARFGGNHQIPWIRVESLSDDFFAHARTIGIRGVNEIDPQFDSPPQDSDGFWPVCRLAPNAFSSDPHGAESQPRDPKILADEELARLPGKFLPWIPRGCTLLHFSTPFSSDLQPDWGLFPR
jgi:hypothetical protein